jgi:shikimate kinase
MTHIFLYGPPGSGKSTISRKLASNLKLPFIDIDEVIEKKISMTITQFMGENGEPAFRDIETATLKSLADDKPSVVSLGGGALLRDENRAFAESHGKIILLMAKLETLLERLHYESGKRPLLAGDLREKLTNLLARRKDHTIPSLC